MPTSTPPPTLRFTPGSTSTPLTDAERRDLTRELVAELSRVTRLLELANDAGTEEADTDAREELLAKRRAFTEALERIGNGRYGFCTECEAPIPYGRLLLRPEASHCADCPSVT